MLIGRFLLLEMTDFIAYRPRRREGLLGTGKVEMPSRCSVSFLKQSRRGKQVCNLQFRQGEQPAFNIRSVLLSCS